MRHGCYRVAVTFGSVLLLISLALPTFRGWGGRVRGWELVLFSPVWVFTPAILLVYCYVAAVIALVALSRVRIGGGLLLGILPAVPVSWLAVYNNAGHPVWAAGVTLLVVASAYMYGWER